MLDELGCSTVAAQDTYGTRTQLSSKTCELPSLGSESEKQNAPDLRAQFSERLEQITNKSTGEVPSNCNEQRASSSGSVGTAESEYPLSALPFELAWLGHIAPKTAKELTLRCVVERLDWPSWTTLSMHIQNSIVSADRGNVRQGLQLGLELYMIASFTQMRCSTLFPRLMNMPKTHSL